MPYGEFEFVAAVRKISHPDTGVAVDPGTVGVVMNDTIVNGQQLYWVSFRRSVHIPRVPEDYLEPGGSKVLWLAEWGEERFKAGKSAAWGRAFIVGLVVGIVLTLLFLWNQGLG